MEGKKGKDDNTGDLFGDAASDLAVVEHESKPVAKALAKSEASGGGGNLPPHFAPMSGEYGDALPIGRYASTQYLQYAIATVKDRALPRVGDGQKPVQGRILYSMWDTGTRAGTKRTKSAAVVGEVLGKLHPHGDQSAPCTARRRTAPRQSAIDGEGTPARAMRRSRGLSYTEVRLARLPKCCCPNGWALSTSFPRRGTPETGGSCWRGCRPCC
jgi:topoisomerase-4 subunit A